jgi:hypothetical protein
MPGWERHMAVVPEVGLTVSMMVEVTRVMVRLEERDEMLPKSCDEGVWQFTHQHPQAEGL